MLFADLLKAFWIYSEFELNFPYLAYAILVLHVTLEEQISTLVEHTASDGCSQIEHRTVLLNKFLQTLVIRILFNGTGKAKNHSLNKLSRHALGLKCKSFRLPSCERLSRARTTYHNIVALNARHDSFKTLVLLSCCQMGVHTAHEIVDTVNLQKNIQLDNGTNSDHAERKHLICDSAFNSTQDCSLPCLGLQRLPSRRSSRQIESFSICIYLCGVGLFINLPSRFPERDICQHHSRTRGALEHGNSKQEFPQEEACLNSVGEIAQWLSSDWIELLAVST